MIVLMPAASACSTMRRTASSLVIVYRTTHRPRISSKARAERAVGASGRGSAAAGGSVSTVVRGGSITAGPGTGAPTIVHPEAAMTKTAENIRAATRPRPGRRRRLRDRAGWRAIVTAAP